MAPSAPAVVLDRDGLRGTIEHPDRLGAGPEARVELVFEGGRRVEAPVGALAAQEDGTFRLPLAVAELAAAREAQVTVIPVVAEQAEVRKRAVETGRVRVAKVVREREEVIDEPLLRDEVEIERVAINRPLDGPVAVRREGDTIVIPLVEEVLVVEKRLVLREELRVSRRRVEEHRPSRVTLRREEVHIERAAPRNIEENSNV
jgi:uncharacterized protein (TIGR02271 family)